MSQRLWLDLGNTRLKYWISDHQNQLLEHDAELHLQSPRDLLRGLLSHLRHWQFECIGISSVLDHATNQRVADVLARLNAPVYFARVQQHYGELTTDYDIQQLGIDRWLQVLAMIDQPSRYCVIGCGTALTIDLLDHNRHLGGYILPSFYLQRDALNQGTKGIKIAPQAFAQLSCGTNTGDAVHHGIALGVLGAVNSIQQRYPDFDLILTGGDAALLYDMLHQHNALSSHIAIRIEPDLLLSGLQRYIAVATTLVNPH